jgi:hypothetical protein
MGTRGTYGWKHDGKFHLFYNHYDSYPEGLGRSVMGFIMDLDKEKFLKNAEKLIVIDEDTIPTEKDYEMYGKFWDKHVSDGISWYSLLRHIQDEYMEHIQLGDLHHSPENNGFIKDSLFCEFGYVINFDTKKEEST